MEREKFLKLLFMEKQNFATLISIDEQLKVLETAIRKGSYDKVRQLANDGYTFSVFIFDLLRNCNQAEIIDYVWNTNFNFKGAAKDLLKFVIAYKGKYEAARFITERTEQCRVWHQCSSYFDNDMLEHIEDWSELLRRNAVDVLAKHKRYDDIILGYDILSSAGKEEAVQIFKDNELEAQIIKLKKYQWMLCDEWYPEGVQYLIDNGQADIIVDSYEYVVNPTQAVRLLCSYASGRQLLRSKGKYVWLGLTGCFQYLIDDKQWKILLDLKKYNLIDWMSWYRTSEDKAEVIKQAENTGQWEFLFDAGKYWYLLKHGEICIMFRKVLQKIGF